jgi:hypothetical protein
VNWYLAVLKNYAGFSGRARRQEYWMYALFNFIVTVVLEIFFASTNSIAFPGNSGYLWSGHDHSESRGPGSPPARHEPLRWLVLHRVRAFGRRDHPAGLHLH